jgi:hypothetical protein
MIFMQVAMLDFSIGLVHTFFVPANSVLLAQRLPRLYCPAAFAVSGDHPASASLLL